MRLELLFLLFSGRFWRWFFITGLYGLPQIGVFAHPIAVATDVDHMTVMYESVNERGRHDFVTQNSAPVGERDRRERHYSGKQKRVKDF